MDVINGFVTKLFDLLLIPLEWMGSAMALILISGVFGVLALVAFKHISSQQGIKKAKGQIKGNMIAIRIYQNDLVVVGKSIFKVLGRNLQYVSLNFGPFIPLAIPFVFVVAQMVVRYSFEPAPVVPIEEVAKLMPKQGIMVRVELALEHRAEAAGLSIVLPEGVVATSPLVRSATKGLAWQEVVPTSAGVHELEIRLADGTSVKKLLAAGDATPRMMQQDRYRGLFSAWMWPAEDRLPADGPFEKVALVGAYGDRDLGWLPGSGFGAVFLWFVIASMVFAFAAVKPLGVQI